MRASLLRREPLSVSLLVHVERYSVMWKTQCIFVLLSIRSSATHSFILPYITIHCSVYVDVCVCVCVFMRLLPACLPTCLSVCLSVSPQHEEAMTQWKFICDLRHFLFCKIHIFFCWLMSSRTLSVLKHKWELNYSNYIYSSLHIKWIKTRIKL